MDIIIKPDEIGIVQSMTSASDRPNKAQLCKTAGQFESYFITQVLKELGKTISSSKKSYAEETQMAFMYEKMGEFLSKKGVGIKEMIMRYMDQGTKVPSGKSDNVNK
jgi:Rod binding domain-containing protein